MTLCLLSPHKRFFARKIVSGKPVRECIAGLFTAEEMGEMVTLRHLLKTADSVAFPGVFCHEIADRSGAANASFGPTINTCSGGA